MKRKTVVFDLDDTLVYEINYLKSAFISISQIIDKEKSQNIFLEMMDLYNNKQNVFLEICSRYNNIHKDALMSIYRNHYPSIKLIDGAKEVLNVLKSDKNICLGLITDGYSVTQRNKLKATGIEVYFDDIIISEEFGSQKNSENNFKFFHKNCSENYYYIGDNTSKDFIIPNSLGWTTICLLDKGENIHKQDFNLPKINIPNYCVKDLNKVIKIIE